MDDQSDLHPELVRDGGPVDLLAHVTGRRARGGRLAAAYVRLVDKAVVEYQAARVALAQFERDHTSRSNACVQTSGLARADPQPGARALRRHL